MARLLSRRRGAKSTKDLSESQKKGIVLVACFVLATLIQLWGSSSGTDSSGSSLQELAAVSLAKEQQSTESADQAARAAEAYEKAASLKEPYKKVWENLKEEYQEKELGQVKADSEAAKATIGSNNFADLKKSTKENPVTIAYAVSLIKCSDRQSSIEGLSDAAVVLRHSIHLNSVRNYAESGSRYDYKMIAIVHEQAKGCTQELEDAGFEIIVRPKPVEQSDIRGAHLRKYIHREWCCGHDEFVKLYAYQLTDYPIVVHMDIDFGINRPLDHLYDLMLDPQDPVAKQQIKLEFPDRPWPTRIDAFMTRDWPQVRPGRKAAYQAGFIVLRPDPKVFDHVVEIIREGNYTDGFSRQNGWAGLGYGGFVGAMAMQGLMAYYYDQFKPDTWVELDECRHNHMGMDIQYNRNGNQEVKGWQKGVCRNGNPTCEDCRKTNISDIYSIHYTQCRKPWQCIGEQNDQGKTVIPTWFVDYEHCLELLKLWHDRRRDLETKLFQLTGDESIKNGQAGNYMSEKFMGHCKGNGNSEYIPISASKEALRRLPELYK